MGAKTRPRKGRRVPATLVTLPINAGETSPAYTAFGQWEALEDAALCAAVAVHGAGAWSYISEFVGARSAKQCRERWYNHMKPGLITTSFTAEEDELLWKAVYDQGRKWATIAADQFPGRCDGMLKNRWVVLHKRLRGAAPGPELPQRVEGSRGEEVAGPTRDPVRSLVLSLDPSELHLIFDKELTKLGFVPVEQWATPPEHAQKDRLPLPPAALTTNKWLAVLNSSPTGLTGSLVQGEPFATINSALRYQNDARGDAWDGLPHRFRPLENGEIRMQ